MDITQDLNALEETFTANGYELNLVGGYVRDKILGKNSKDIDLCTNATPQQTKTLLNQIFPTVYETGIEYGTVCAAKNGNIWEITTYRTETYEPGNRKPKTTYGTDLTGDLQRRDYTINAIAYNLKDKKIIDPFNGKKDLEKGILKTPQEPNQTFQDDPLRILRGIRFLSRYGYTIEPETLQAMKTNNHMLENISKERIHDELTKIFDGKHTQEAVETLKTTEVSKHTLKGLTIQTTHLNSLNGNLTRIAYSLQNNPIENIQKALNDLRFEKQEIQTITKTLQTINEYQEPGEQNYKLRKLSGSPQHTAALQIIEITNPGTTQKLENLLKEENTQNYQTPINGKTLIETLDLKSGKNIGIILKTIQEHIWTNGPITQQKALDIAKNISQLTIKNNQKNCAQQTTITK